MRFVLSMLVLATWLLVSAFALPHTPFTMGATWVAAVVIATCAVVAKGYPGARYVISAVAFALAVMAIVVRGVGASAVVNTLLVAALLFVLALVRPTPLPDAKARA
jgi:hypothetical protein